MIPEYPKFKPINLDDLPEIKNFLANYHPSICELSPANLIIWQDFDRYQLTRINNNLCILNDPLTEPCFFFAPIGNNKLVETTNTCLKHCSSISRAREDFIKQLSSEKYHFKCLRSHFDYVYSTQELADLAGRKFDGKRNHINRFLKHYPNYQLVDFDKPLQNQAFALFDQWFALRQESRFFPKLAYDGQKKALAKAFKFFKELNLKGSAIIDNKEMLGFYIGSRLNEETAALHFLYGHPKVPGITQILLQQACAKTFSQYKFINQEQDLGIPGLRQAKLSYYPHHLEKKFEIRLK